MYIVRRPWEQQLKIFWERYTVAVYRVGMDSDIETEQTLRRLYHSPATGYQSAERL